MNTKALLIALLLQQLEKGATDDDCDQEHRVIALISYLCSQFHSECIQIHTISHTDAISLP